MHGINGEAIQKASNIINEILEDGRKLKKYKITPSQFYEFYDGIQKVYNNGITSTISEAVKNLYVKCGLVAEVEGIGWSINGII